jgi:hypothetical protein
MDWQTYFNIGLAAAFTSIGWFAKQLWYAVNQLKTDLKMRDVKLQHQELCKDIYVLLKA